MKMKHIIGGWVFLLSGIFCSDLYGQFDIYSRQESVGDKVNSKYFESNPVLSSDGKSLYFNRANHPGNIGGVDDPADIWYSTIQPDGSWSAAINVGEPLNDAEENLLIGFMDDGRAMLVHHPKGFAFSYYMDGKWLKPTPFDIPFFDNRGPEKSGSISFNGRYMVFALETYGTYGVEDIYVTQLMPDGKWGTLKNLGNTINTRFQEITPFLAPDNKTLFFSSNGHGGRGSFDIYMSERLDDTWRNWSKPKNLGPFVNTSGADMSFNFLPDSEYAYLVSTVDSQGYGDIKQVRIATNSFEVDSSRVERDETAMTSQELSAEELKNAAQFKGVIMNSKSRSPLIAQITFEADGGRTITVESSMDGRFTVELPKDHIYEMTIKSQDYFKADTTFFLTTSYESGKINSFLLEPLAVGNKIKLNNILFYRSTAELVEGSERELDRMAEMMRDNPTMEIFLEGHTDNRGDFKLNLELSEERVSSVKQYLLRKGIEAHRIDGKGYGSTRPIAGNSSEADRQRNRRVEFEIIKM